MLNKTKQTELISAFRILMEELAYTRHNKNIDHQFCETVTKQFKELQQNEDWIKFCYTFDFKNVTTYLQVPPKIRIKYDGKSILTWNKKDITKEAVSIALRAQFKLTVRQAFTCTKIKQKLSNEDVYSLFKQGFPKDTSILDTRYILGWKRKGTPFAKIVKIKTVTDWVNALNLKKIFSIDPYQNAYCLTEIVKNDEIKDGCKLLGAPNEVLTLVEYFYEYIKRIKATLFPNGYFNSAVTKWSRIKPIPVSTDPKIEAEIITLAKLNGIPYSSRIKDLSTDETEYTTYINNALSALYLYYLTKINATL